MARTDARTLEDLGSHKNDYDKEETGQQTHGLTIKPKFAPGTLGELEHEKDMIAQGRARFLDRKQKKKVWSNEGKPRALIDDMVVVVAKSLKKIHDDEIGANHRPFAWMDVWSELLELPNGAEVMALAGMSVMMDAVACGRTLNSCLVQMGKSLEMELWSARLRAFDKKLAKRIEDKVRRDHVSMRYRMKAAKAIAGNEGFREKGFKPSEAVKMAAPLMSCILANTELFEVWDFHDGDGKTVRRVGLTEATSDLIAESEYTESWMEPMWQPMIVPPQDWDGYNTGAYLDPSLSLQLKLVKGANRQQVRDINKRLERGDLKDLLDSLNLIQRTPYKINSYTLAAVYWAWQNDIPVKKFPQHDHVELEPRPDTYEGWTPEQKKGWIIERRKKLMRNREIDGARVIMYHDLSTAFFLEQYDEFYLPHNMDFRGRIYPVPSFNHHRDSYCKSMFLLQRAKPIGEEGFKFLALKVADLGDFDKISKKPLQERLDWVIANEEQIIKCGTDFAGSYDYWSQADKPFEFLAACHEYAQVCEHGFSYKCGLPIGLDGSNSAAQHYSAASRSREEGHMVNLTVSEQPQDIYQVVADKVIAQLEEDGTPPAKLWLDYGVTRSVVKRQTMTFGYGSNLFGFAEQIKDDLMKPLANDVMKGRLEAHPFGDDDGYQAANFMAKHVWKAVNEVIFKGAEGMAYFKALADICSKDGKLMAWTTPLNFPVYHRYDQMVGKKIKLYLHDRDTNVRKRTQVTVLEKREERDDLTTPDKRKNRSSVSPNVIHSMDACHLQMTVLNAVDRYRIRDFFLIHDSFGVMPADCPRMFNAVRQSFVELYRDNCLYTMLANQVREYIDNPDKADFPETPEKGDLVLEDVLRSQYCFL